MKLVLFLPILLAAKLLSSNMGSPIWEGTRIGSPFSSRNVDVINEKIHVTFHPGFDRAHYTIEYLIRSDTHGVQIPLLFYALDYEGEFKVLFDDIEIAVHEFSPDSIYDWDAFVRTDSLFAGFWDSRSAAVIDSQNRVLISWGPDASHYCSLSDLKYFKVDISKSVHYTGTHVIRVEYLSKIWEDRTGYVEELQHRYFLFPGTSWKSFGQLSVTIDATSLDFEVETNLGLPMNGSIDSIATWTFDSLPADYILFSHIPEVSSFAEIMIVVNPLRWAFVVAIILGIVHYIFMRRFRRKFPSRKVNWVMIIGGIVNPGLFLLGFYYMIELTHYAIGEPATDFNAYSFAVFFYYPILCPIYLLLMLCLDFVSKLKLAVKR